jgi:hypothetical protein
MITYELAKKLKDAGFPQKGECFESENLDSAANSGVNVFRENVYYPNLSELIEACGNGFRALGRETDLEGTWVACEDITQGDEWKNSRHGSTPEEAVAHLFLELNKK